MDDCQSLLQAHRRLQASYHLLQESHLHFEDQVNTMVDSLEMFAHIVTELRDCWVWTADDTVHASPTSMQFPFEQLHQQATNEDIARPSLIFTMVTKPDVLNSPSSSTPSLSQQGTESDIDVSDAPSLPPLTEGSPPRLIAPLPYRALLPHTEVATTVTWGGGLGTISEGSWGPPKLFPQLLLIFDRKAAGISGEFTPGSTTSMPTIATILTENDNTMDTDSVAAEEMVTGEQAVGEDEEDAGAMSGKCLARQ